MGKTLKQRYEEVAQEYRVAMIKKYYPYEVPFADSYWVGDEIGGVLYVCDAFIDYNTLRWIVDEDIRYDKWVDWCQYCEIVGDFGIKTPTLKEWCEGRKVLSQEQIQKLAKAKQELQDLIDDDKQYLKGGF